MTKLQGINRYKQTN